MLSWSKVCRSRGRGLRALTGLERSEFKGLVSVFSESVEQARPSWVTVTEKQRQRRAGAGPREALGTEDALLMILVYFRQYPTQDLLALLFGGTQAWACKWVHRLTPVLQAALGEKKKLPTRPKGRPVGTLEELMEQCPQLSFIIDGTERPVQRPKDKDKQKACYSGKKKRHTRKHTVVSARHTGRVLALSRPFDGRVHDKRMAETEPITFPNGSTVYQDTGYQGYQPPGKNLFVLQPRKKRKGQPRDDKDKTFNRFISQRRVRVEHAIGGVKRSRIASDIYRNRKPGFDDLSMHVACGLHNLRAESRAYYATA